jgi:hypothetical protein
MNKADKSMTSSPATNTGALQPVTQALERLSFTLDRPAYAGLIRVVTGYLLPPVLAAMASDFQDAYLPLCFVSILAAYRLFPLLLRKSLPFGDSARAFWTDRRRLAKRFDSYQWQKLFWFGLGLLLYRLHSGNGSDTLRILIYLTVGPGALGTVIWRYRMSQLAQAGTGSITVKHDTPLVPNSAMGTGQGVRSK